MKLLSVISYEQKLQIIYFYVHFPLNKAIFAPRICQALHFKCHICFIECKSMQQ